jgi:hypothetical protein
MHHRILLAFAFVACWVTSTHASDPSVLAIYGDGVHSFYAGNFQQSYDYLSQVVDIGTDDPRVYYFRGLSALRLGSQRDADDDFTKGAAFEAERGNTRTVSRALERIQGPDRLLLEQSRSEARLALARRKKPELSSSRQGFLSGGRRYSGIGGTESQETLPKPEVQIAQPVPEEKSAETAIVAEKADEAEPMQPLGAEKAQRDSDAFFGNTEEDTSGMAENSEPAAADSDKKTKALFDDPFGDDPFADGPRRTDPMPDQPSPDKDSKTMTTGDFDDPFNFAPRKPAGSNTQRDQIEMQNEMLDAEAADSRDQREAMNERDAAAGD